MAKSNDLTLWHSSLDKFLYMCFTVWIFRSIQFDYQKRFYSKYFISIFMIKVLKTTMCVVQLSSFTLFWKKQLIFHKKNKYLHGTYDLQFGPIMSLPVISLQHMHVFVYSSWLIMTSISMVVAHVPTHLLLLLILAILWHDVFGYLIVLMTYWLLKTVDSLRIAFETKNINK